MKMCIRDSSYLEPDSTLIEKLAEPTDLVSVDTAAADSIEQMCIRDRAWAVITTHYQNLKHFAEDHPGVANGAMLYDRHEMRISDWSSDVCSSDLVRT